MTEDRPRSQEEKEVAVPSLLPPSFALNVVDNDDHNSLCAEGRIGGKACLTNIATSAVVTIARPDTVAGLAEREPSPKFTLQMPSGWALPILKEALLTLTPGWHPLTTWVYIANIADKFILGLNILCSQWRFISCDYLIQKVIALLVITLQKRQSRTHTLALVLFSEHPWHPSCTKFFVVEMLRNNFMNQ
jgi:hypothetical protein